MKKSIEKRKRQILNNCYAGITDEKSFAKKDVEPELRKFQASIVSTVFEEKHGEDLRIKDVQLHINSLAEEQHLLLNEKIVEFNAMSNELNKLLGQEIAGNKGERKLERNMKMIQVENEYLTNVELNSEDIVSEIDGIVITSKAIFLLEAKYSVNDMCITSDGNYCRAENHSIVYGNIGDKVNEKEYLLRQALKNKGFDKEIKIYRILVYTNNDTKLFNYYKYLKKCSCNQLHYFIEEFDGEDIYTTEDMSFIKTSLFEASEIKKYPIDFNFKKYEELFADVLIMTEHPHNMEDTIIDYTKKIDWKKVAKYSALATCSTVFLTTRIMKRIL